MIRICFFVLCISLCFSCQKSGKNSIQAPVNCLRTCFAQDPRTLDPRRSSDFVSSTLICLLYEGLTRCTGGSDIELALAQKVEISPDGKTYFFFLRKSVWSDGVPVTARDFEKSWKKILDPQWISPCAYLLYPIKNAENYAKGLCAVEDVAIYAMDDFILKVELETATPYFLSLTAFPLYLPTPAHIEENPSYWMEQSLPSLVSNGPFYLEKLRPGAEISLKKNQRFWNGGKILLDQIHITIVGSEMTALHLFEKGELDVIGGPLLPLTSELIQEWKGNGSLQHLPMAASTFCALNTTSFPFHNFALRKAFSLAVVDKIPQEVKEMGQIPASHFLPPTLDHSVGFEWKRLEEKTAEEWLEIALQELQITREDLSSLVLYYRASPIEKKLAQTLQTMWMETLGIPMRIEQIESQSLVQKLYQKNYQISMASWIAQFHDPINLLDRFKDVESQKNYSGWSSLLYKEFLRQIACARDPEERSSQMVEAAELLQDAAPLIPLYHWSYPFLVNPRIQGLVTTSSGGILLEKCSIVSESSSPHR